MTNKTAPRGSTAKAGRKSKPSKYTPKYSITLCQNIFKKNHSGTGIFWGINIIISN